MAGIVEFNRYAFLGVGTVRTYILVIGIVTGIFLLISGLLIFNKVQRTFIDTI